MRQKRRYILSLENRGKLSSVFSLKFSRAGLLWLCAGIVLLILTVSLLLVALTPLGRLLSASRGGDDAGRVNALISTVDSLKARCDARDVYLANLRSLLDPDRRERSDSLTSAVSIVPADSLLPPSSRERSFVSMISARERRSGTLLANDARYVLSFSSPAPGATISKASKGTGKLVFLVPLESDVYAVADGRVVEKYYSASSGGFVMLVQHGRGYVSRYAGLPNPLVDVGDMVGAGQAVSSSVNRPGRGSVTLEMWHDGDRLLPELFINSPISEIK